MRHLFAVLSCLLFIPSPVWAERFTVFAAASLNGVLTEAAADFQDQTGHRLRLTFAGSSVLARQIQFGAPADVFVSANQTWMELLQEDGIVQKDQTSVIAANRLVLVAPTKDTPDPLAKSWPIAERLGQGRLAMALVDAVPAGIYGKAALEALGLWQDLAPKVAQTDNARAALALVALGEAPLGIVYQTDALAEPRVTEIALFPEASHPPIRYPAAVVRDGAAARDFLSFLTSPEGQKHFAAHGFLAVPE